LAWSAQPHNNALLASKKPLIFNLRQIFHFANGPSNDFIEHGMNASVTSNAYELTLFGQLAARLYGKFIIGSYFLVPPIGDGLNTFRTAFRAACDIFSLPSSSDSIHQLDEKGDVHHSTALQFLTKI
jgi:hypothetical protein